MKINTLLNIHSRHLEYTDQSEILCGGYLLKENFIYRNLCKAALGAGYKYVPAWDSYLVSPLTEFEAIIQKKKIPYLKYVPLIQSIEKRSNGQFQIADLPISLEMRHMHETAHVVADLIFEKTNFTNEKKNIIKMYLCESFANTCESMAVRLALTQTHRTIMHMHSYIQENASERFAKDRLINNIGFKNTFALVLISYLYSNFLYTTIDFKTAKKVLKLIDSTIIFSPQIAKDTGIIFKAAFDLNIQFRLKTNSFFLKMLGYKKDFFNILDFDFLKIIDTDPDLYQALIQMEAVVSGEQVLAPEKAKHRPIKLVAA